MTRQPTPGGDNGTWGTVLNDYLTVAHNDSGTLKSSAIIVADPTLAGNPQWFPLYKAASYYFCNSPGANGTASYVNQQLRLAPFVVTRSLSITRLGAEFTAAGTDANSILRLGIYADDGNGQPGGNAVLDAGSISTGTGNAGTVATGGTPGSYEITVSATLSPGLYWVGGVTQGAPGTVPVIRSISSTSIVAPLSSSTIPGTNATWSAYTLSSVSGALPTWSGSAVPGSGAPRVFFKVA